MAKQQCEPSKQGSLGKLLNTMQMLNTVEKDLKASRRTLLPLLPTLVTQVLNTDSTREAGVVSSTAGQAKHPEPFTRQFCTALDKQQHEGLLQLLNICTHLFR